MDYRVEVSNVQIVVIKKVRGFVSSGEIRLGLSMAFILFNGYEAETSVR